MPRAEGNIYIYVQYINPSMMQKATNHLRGPLEKPPVEFPEHRESVFPLAVREENMQRETQCDQIRLMTRQRESMTNL